jgi:hypothetical protein
MDLLSLMEKELEWGYTISNSSVFIRCSTGRLRLRRKGGHSSKPGGGKMKKPVDIFWFGESGPVWVEAAPTMERAKACVDALPLKTSGGYAAVDHRTGTSMSFEPNLMDGRRSAWRIEKTTRSRIK